MAIGAAPAFLILASYLLVALARSGAERRPLLLALLVVATALHALSLVNVLGGGLPGTQWDAGTFHQQARRLAETGAWPEVSLGAPLYEYVLTAGYRVFGADLLVGQSLSVLATLATLLVVDAVGVRLGVRDVRVRAGVVLVAGLFPTLLYHGALTFREPYQVLGLAAGTLCALKAMPQGQWTWPAGAAACWLFMGLFHHVLLGVAVVLVCMLIVFRYAPRLQDARRGLVVAVLVAAVGGAGYLGMTRLPVTSQNDYIKEIHEAGGPLTAIIDYRATIESEQPRTSYQSPIDTAGSLGVAAGLLNNYWNYLARPFVTDLERATDSAPLAAALGRLLLLGGILWLAAARGVCGRDLAFCLAVYLLVTAVWSLGTTNYGQAFRHHAVSDWLLAAALAGAWSTDAAARRAGRGGPEAR